MRAKPIQAYIISLPGDEARYNVVAERLSATQFIEPCRIEALWGRLLSDLACRALTKNAYSVNHKGTLGCFLTHVKAWEAIAGSPDPFALILEDDIFFGDNLASLEELIIPPGTDLIFCNDSTAYPGPVGLRPIAPAIPFFIGEKKAVGGYGYILTPAGAGNLLRYVAIDSFFSHVDLRMMAYSVTLEEAQAYAPLGMMAANIADMRNTYQAQHSLLSWSMFPAIAFHPRQPSKRGDQDYTHQGLVAL